MRSHSGNLESNLALATCEVFERRFSLAFQADLRSAQHDTASRPVSKQDIAFRYYKRSNMLERIRHYDDALEQASFISYYAPKWSLGYIQETRLLIQLKRYRHALQVLNEASSVVSDTGRELIARQRQELAAIINEDNMQHLGRLSPEIFDMVFEQLDLRDHVQCMRVCRSWKQCFLQWPLMWYSVSINNFSFRLERSYRDLVRCIANKNVGRICIHTETRDENRGRSHDLIKVARFLCDEPVTGLQETELEASDREIFPCYMRLLERNSESLRSLKLVASGPGASRNYLSVILNTCSVLEVLRVESSSYDRQGKFELPSSLSLKHLVWSIRDTKNAPPDLLEIIKRSPKLKTFAVDECYGYLSMQIKSSIITQLIDSCPSLYRLQTRCPNLGSEGTRSLARSVIDVDECFGLKELSSLVQRISHRLEQLRMQLDNKDKELQLWTIGGFKRLQSICLNCRVAFKDSRDSVDESQKSVSIASFFMKCPLLETVSLGWFDFTGCNVSSAFSSLKHLRQLRLNSCKGLNMTEFKNVAPRCKSLEQLSFSVDKRFYNGQKIVSVADIMQAASAFPNLRVLDISSNVQHDGCEEFIKNLKSTRLVYLIVDFGITVHALEHLLSIPTLDSVYLDLNSNLTDSEVSTALRHSNPTTTTTTTTTVYHKEINEWTRFHKDHKNRILSEQARTPDKMRKLRIY